VEIETRWQLHRAFRACRSDGPQLRLVGRDVGPGRRPAKELGNGGYPRIRPREWTACPPSGGSPRGGIGTPLGSNVAVTCFPDLEECVRKRAVQVVLCDVHYWGGLRAVQHLGKLCKTFGLGLSMHSNSHLGISVMAMAHAAAATPHLTYACDTHYPWSDAKDEVVAGARSSSQLMRPHP
jgi:hypothetical protein